MKVLLYVDMNILSKVSAAASAVSEAAPNLIDPKMAEEFTHSVINCSIPLPDVIAEQIVREMWDAIRDSGIGMGGGGH